MAMTELDKLMRQIRKTFGDDVIIVHRGKDKAACVDYYVTSSALAPAQTREALASLLSRWR